MKKQKYLCVDLATEMLVSNIQENENRKGVLTMVREGEEFIFKESQAPVHVEHPELQQKLLDRSKHGRVKMDSRGVFVEFYIRHNEYANGRELADMLASEIETLGEKMCESPLPPAMPYPFPKSPSAKGKGEVSNESEL